MKLCGNPVVNTGLSISQCFYKNAPLEAQVVPEFQEIKDVPQDDLDRSFLATGDGANVAASQDVSGVVEKSTFHTQDSEDSRDRSGDTD